MKTELLFLCLFYASINLYSQCPDGAPPDGYTCIPDLAFEQYLIEYSIDSNPTPDQQVLTSALSAVTQLPVYNRGISSLEGIQDFPNLMQLFCENNNLTNLDLSNNLNLVVLICHTNQLESLILPSSDFLDYLSCYNNNLDELNVSNSSNLRILECSDNSLNTLNIENNVMLTGLDCNNNDLYDLDVASNIGLSTLSCEGNFISNINLSNNSILVGLNLNSNQLIELDVSNNPNLVGVYCANNMLQYLNIQNSNNTELVEFSAINNALTCIQVDNVELANMNGEWYKDNEAEYMLFCPSLSTDESDLVNISIYPNPIKEHVSIELYFDAEYSLINIHGQKIQKGSLASGINRIDLSSISDGFYLIRLETKQGHTLKKIIKN